MTGDPEEWATWLDRHGPTLVLLARQRVASRADAEDVVQEAFVRFWRARHRATDPLAFLYTCVTRCALDWRRTRGRRARREQLAARPEADPYFDGPTGPDERSTTVEGFLRGLPEDQREVLVMKIWGGLSFPQIAEALRISANTASSRYRYALTKLRARSAEELIP
jgi:RNA polymerase sigma-70 factor (ECF subfamily)